MFWGEGIYVYNNPKQIENAKHLLHANQVLVYYYLSFIGW